MSAEVNLLLGQNPKLIANFFEAQWPITNFIMLTWDEEAQYKLNEVG